MKSQSDDFWFSHFSFVWHSDVREMTTHTNTTTPKHFLQAIKSVAARQTRQIEIVCQESNRMRKFILSLDHKINEFIIQGGLHRDD